MLYAAKTQFIASQSEFTQYVMPRYSEGIIVLQKEMKNQMYMEDVSGNSGAIIMTIKNEEENLLQR